MTHTRNEIILNSGGRGLIVHVPGSTVVELEFTFLSGFDYAPASKYELPHSMEHLLMSANEHYRTKTTFARELEKNGAYTNAYTSQLLNGYIATTPEFEWQRVTELFWQGLTAPLFRPSEFSSEHETVREELLTKLESHSLMLHIATKRSIEHGSKTFTYPKRIKLLPAIRVKDLRNYYQQTHTAANMRFIVAGDFAGKKRELRHLLERYTAHLPNGLRASLIPVRLRASNAPVVLSRDIEKVYFDIKAAISRELSEREIIAMNILGQILTGSWDSRIFGKARNKGLVYYLGSGLSVLSGTSTYSIFGTVDPAKMTKLSELIKRELLRIRDNGVNPAELRRAKANMLGSFQISYQTPHSMLAWYSRYFVYDDVYDFGHQPQLIRSIRQSDIMKLLEYFFSNRTYWTCGVLARNPRTAADTLYQEIRQVWG